MGAAISITRLDLTASELRKAASGEKIVPRRVGYLRLRWFSMAWTVKRRGNLRHGPSDLAGLVHRYNAAGLAGLRNLKSPGPGSKLHGAAAGRIGRACRGWPRPCGARGSALAAGRSARRIAAALRCCAHERSVGKVLAKLGYRKLSARPRHHRLTKKPRRRLKKLRRDSRGANPRPCQRQADRNLVPRCGRIGHRAR